MIPRCLTCLACAVCLLTASCGRRPEAVFFTPPFDLSRVDGAKALREATEFTAIGPRVSGTAAAEKAAHHIQARLQDLGVPARVDEFEEDTPSGTIRFRNVIGRKEGAGRGSVLLTCHYDTKDGIPGFVGANDSGSGVGVLLALAAALRTNRLDGPSITFAFLDGEECRVEYGPHDGLHGSRRLADELVKSGGRESVRAVIVVDMVGDRDLSLTLPRNGSPELTQAALRAAAAEGVRSKVSLWRREVLDDHQPFLDAGMRAVDLIDFEYGSQKGMNDYWHTAADTVDKLSGESLGAVARIAARMANEATQEASGPASLSPPN